MWWGRVDGRTGELAAAGREAEVEQDPAGEVDDDAGDLRSACGRVLVRGRNVTRVAAPGKRKGCRSVEGGAHQQPGQREVGEDRRDDQPHHPADPPQHPQDPRERAAGLIVGGCLIGARGSLGRCDRERRQQGKQRQRQRRGATEPSHPSPGPAEAWRRPGPPGRGRPRAVPCLVYVRVLVPYAVLQLARDLFGSQIYLDRRSRGM